MWMLRFAKPGDALMAAAIPRWQYFVGISKKQDTESVHKFLKSLRGGNSDCCILNPVMSTIKVSIDERDVSALAVGIK